MQSLAVFLMRYKPINAAKVFFFFTLCAIYDEHFLLGVLLRNCVARGWWLIEDRATQGEDDKIILGRPVGNRLSAPSAVSLTAHRKFTVGFLHLTRVVNEISNEKRRD